VEKVEEVEEVRASEGSSKVDEAGPGSSTPLIDLSTY
jgi:hypothetical protein